MMREIAGLAEIARRFDGMIIDQFGVLHDGRSLYPGSVEVMAELKAAGIPVAIVTNSGKRTAANVTRIVKMGIPRNQFVDCISSGEVAYRSLTTRKALLIGREGDDYGFDGITIVERAEDAEILLILGSNAPETSLADYRVMLADIKLPALCCNPDKLMLTAQGLQPAPGAIAALYEDMGGQVTWIGKPYRGIYDAALAAMGAPKRVLCVGDSAEHDVAGGRNAGLATLLVRQGVSAHVALADIAPKPDYIMPGFSWHG